MVFFPEIAVNQLDQLSPEEQLLVKCAAVIGHSFHIDLLQHLLPGWHKNKLLQVLRALVDIQVLRWFNKSQELPAESVLVPSSIKTIKHTKEEEKKKSGQEELLPSYLNREPWVGISVFRKNSNILYHGPQFPKTVAKKWGKVIILITKEP